MANQRFNVGFIGVGRPRSTEGATGFGMAYEHADGYVKTGRCNMVACADINEDNAKAFAARYGIERIYTDYHKMLAECELDFVSISTWPHLHAPMVIDTARAGVKAIHCEKPMSVTWGEAKEMVRVAEENHVQLTFNHQRRFLEPFHAAKKLAHDGTIGELVKIEGNCNDMYDWGTHWLDMFFFYNDENPAEWVIGQVDRRGDRLIFGVPIDTQGVCDFRFQNGIRGLLQTGRESHAPVAHRLIGTKGIIELHWDAPHVRYLSENKLGWQIVDQPDNLHGPNGVDRAMADIVDALATGRKSLLDAHNALQATEVIFATYESSRRRARIDLPLTIDDNAFLSMLEKGEIGNGAGR